MHRVQDYIALRLGDVFLVVRAWCELWWVDIMLRKRGFRRWASVARAPRVTSEFVLDASTLQRGRRYARRIRLAARCCPVPAECLHQSLVLHRWLRAEGLPSELRIGVRKNEDQLGAHAWVELDGRILNDRWQSVTQFAELAALEVRS